MTLLLKLFLALIIGAASLYLMFCMILFYDSEIPLFLKLKNKYKILYFISYYIGGITAISAIVAVIVYVVYNTLFTN